MQRDRNRDAIYLAVMGLILAAMIALGFGLFDYFAHSS
jgi:uncharacterized membrane protein